MFVSIDLTNESNFILTINCPNANETFNEVCQPRASIPFEYIFLFIVIDLD